MVRCFAPGAVLGYVYFLGYEFANRFPSLSYINVLAWKIAIDFYILLRGLS